MVILRLCRFHFARSGMRTFFTELCTISNVLSLKLSAVSCSAVSHQQNLNILSVFIRGPKPNLKADRTPKKTSDLATDGHGYTRMRIDGFLALDREKIGTKLYGYVLAKRYTSMPVVEHAAKFPNGMVPPTRARCLSRSRHGLLNH